MNDDVHFNKFIINVIHLSDSLAYDGGRDENVKKIYL